MTIDIIEKVRQYNKLNNKLNGEINKLSYKYAHSPDDDLMDFYFDDSGQYLELHFSYEAACECCSYDYYTVKVKCD